MKGTFTKLVRLKVAKSLNQQLRIDRSLCDENAVYGKGDFFLIAVCLLKDSWEHLYLLLAASLLNVNCAPPLAETKIIQKSKCSK